MTTTPAPELVDEDPAAAHEPPTTWETLRRGLQLAPGFRRDLPGTLLLALVAMVGSVAVPVLVQQVIDRGLRGPGGADLGLVRDAAVAGALALVVTAVATYVMNVRLYRTTETALADLRVRAFRHVHDLSVLHQQAERRGSLVSRVTSDIDQISQFMQWGGVQLLLSSAQLVVATGVMLFYSWQLTLLVYVSFLPMVLGLRLLQRHLVVAYGLVRERIGEMLGAVAESVVGAAVIRSYGVERRTAERIDRAIDGARSAEIRAQAMAAGMFSLGETAAGLANAAVVVAGVLLGVGGHITAGRLVAFLFLVTLFVAPVQTATEVLDQTQNAVAGWRRVIGILDTPSDVSDPAAAGEGRPLPPGPVAVRFHEVGYAYPGADREVLRDVDVAIAPRSRVAVVGETGSGKTTFAKLLTRLMDPVRGEVLLSGVPVAQVPFDELRRRVVMVPQDGFLFDMTVADNVRYGRPGIDDSAVEEAFADLGLDDWLASLPDGVATRVGERGESLSVGERQLVALARARVAEPDLLLLDEATSAVDPATEMRITRALDRLLDGRTSVTIAHRLSTAERADEVLVFDDGVLAERGRHAELVGAGGPYTRLHASWISQARRHPAPPTGHPAG